jgi:hypothetical protein
MNVAEIAKDYRERAKRAFGDCTPENEIQLAILLALADLVDATDAKRK